MKNKFLFSIGSKTSKTLLMVIILLGLLLLQAPTALAQWTRKQDAHKKRSEVSSVVYDGKLYAFIGFGTSSLEVEPSSEVYDPVQDKWTLLASMPEGKTVTHQGVALIDHTVWHIGGRQGNHPAPLTSEVWIYNMKTNTWSPGPQLVNPATGNPLRWGGGGAALLGRTLHVFGGFAINACKNDQDIYHLTLDVDKWLADPNNTKWENKRKPLPIERNHISTTVLNGKIYALGGQFGHDCGGGQDQRISHMYDPITDTWTRLTDLPMVRSHAEGGVFPLDGKIYIVAGQGGLNKVTVFNPEANNGLGSWTDAPEYKLPNGFEGIAAKVIENDFIISHGGINNSANTRKETYTAPITRNPVYKLGFGAECLSQTVDPGETVKTRNLLFTVDGEKQFTTTSSASWLKVTKNATGLAVQTAVEVEVTVDATGLAPGNYRATVTARGTGTGPAYTSASFCVNLRVTGTPGQPSAILINAGGTAQSANGASWEGCNDEAECQGYVKGGFPYTEIPLPAISNVTAPATQAILQTEWTGGQTNGVEPGQVAFAYNIPVENGNYTVRLHFVELNKEKSNQRLFDVNIEGGAKELVNFDIFKEAGGMYKAIVRDFSVSVADGKLHIDFICQKENAKVGAIEILPAASPEATLFEAENAVLYGAEKSQTNSGYSGSSFVDYINPSHDYIEWTVTRQKAGTFDLTFRYANDDTNDRPLRLSVNGAVGRELLGFPTTGNWSNWKTVTVKANLQAGTNKIRLTAKGESGVDIDYLQIEPSGASSTSSANLQIATDQPDETTSKSWAIYPNPAAEVFTVRYETATEGEIQVRIADLSDRTLREFQRTANSGLNQFTCPTDGLSNGLYIVTVKSVDKVTSKRLLIAR